jgi:hypothetical protein
VDVADTWQEPYTPGRSCTSATSTNDKDTGILDHGDHSGLSQTIEDSSHEEIKVTNLGRNWFTQWFIEWWMMEILSWVFGAVCMAIIAIVLSKYDGKQDPKWKIGLSISSFISIFSGFAKSALLLPTAEGKCYQRSIGSVSD